MSRLTFLIISVLSCSIAINAQKHVHNSQKYVSDDIANHIEYKGHDIEIDVKHLIKWPHEDPLDSIEVILWAHCISCPDDSIRCMWGNDAILPIYLDKKERGNVKETLHMHYRPPHYNWYDVDFDIDVSYHLEIMNVDKCRLKCKLREKKEK